jgi:hypothetical protein
VDGPAAGAGGVVGTAVDVPDAMTLWVLPPPPARRAPRAGGALFASAARLYDDDGVSLAYAGGAFRWTNLSCAWSRAGGADAAPATVDSLACSLAPGGGAGFPELPRARAWTVRVVGAWPPAAVAVAGAPAAAAPAAVPGGRYGEGARWPAGGAAWAYDGATASLWLHAPAADADAPLALAVTWPRGADASDPLLTSALARKIARAQAAKQHVNLASWAVVPADVPAMLAAAGVPARVEEAVARAHAGAGAGGGGGAAMAAMIARVRGLYAGLRGNLTDAVAEVDALARGGGVDREHTDAMRELLLNALA